MKKVALAILLASGLMAAGNQDYFGISVGNAKVDFSIKDGIGGTEKADDEGTVVNLTLGHYYGEHGRVSATYTYIKSEDGVDDSDAITLSYDFILPLGKMLALYAGPNIGYTRLEYDAGLDLSGIHYGAQAGAIVRIVPNVEIEGGYRYLFEKGSDRGVIGEIELDNMGMWYVGANFRF